MSRVANILDGKVVETGSTTEKLNNNPNNGVDKEMFLQLLVAQMKYQDPLEPTSNTEYVSQYATFSQVEQLQSMSSTMNNTSAMTLVGKYVTVSYETASGSQSSVSGRVDYVEKSGKDTYLYINGTPYNFDNLETVWDDSYLEAYDYCGAWAKSVNALPKTEQLTLNYESSIKTLREAYNAMTPYQKSFLDSSVVTILEAAELKIAELKKIAESEASKTTADDKNKEQETAKGSETAAAEEGVVTE